MNKNLIYFDHPYNDSIEQFKRLYFPEFENYVKMKKELDQSMSLKSNHFVGTISPILDYLLINQLPLDVCVFSDKPKDVRTLIDNIIFYDAIYVLLNPDFYLGEKKVDPNIIYEYLSLKGVEKSIKFKSFNILGFIMMNSLSLCP